MKILWVVNTIFPDAAKQIGLAPPVYGGWMYGLASNLRVYNNISLSVVTVYPGKDLKSFTVNGIQYYLLPNKTKGERHSNKQESNWKKVVDDFQPDIVHIHGTEFNHGMELMNAYPNLKYAVSLQGLVSVIHRYYLAGMSTWDVLRNITLRDIIRRNTLFHAKHDFYKRGLVEKEYIRRATVVIGRTDWDFAHAIAINPKVNYQFCNESLRDEFYTGESWSLTNCRRHSIFLSQASYPIKGLHQVLKAVAFLKSEFPNILIEVAGHNIIKATTLRERLTLGGYGRYIHHMIKDYGLQKHIKFLGTMSAGEIKKAYLRSHVFVCPSSIENSPNSLGEAQILGVPCIASYSGGIPSMVNEESAILYRFEEYEMLAANLRKIFKDDNHANKISKSGHATSQSRHHRLTNLNNLMAAYEILNR